MLKFFCTLCGAAITMKIKHDLSICNNVGRQQLYIDDICPNCVNNIKDYFTKIIQENKK